MVKHAKKELKFKVYCNCSFENYMEFVSETNTNEFMFRCECGKKVWIIFKSN